MNKYNWENKEKFIADFESSKSICDFLIKNNLTATSGNYKTFTKWYDIHVNQIERLKDGEMKFDEIFQEDSKVGSDSLKRLLKNHRLIEYKCKKCGNDGIWNNKKLKLQLEHINGINNDNRLDNLSYLCPNCHSQTETYAGNNLGKKLFELRITDVKELKIINDDTIKTLANKWNVKIVSVKCWLNKYKEKIFNHNIIIESISNKNITQIKKTSPPKLFRKKTLLREKRLIELQQYQDDPNAFKILNELWQIDNSKQWIKTNYIEYYEKMNKHNIDTYLKPIEFNVIDLKQRKLDLTLITHKKEIKVLANKWNISINGVKKWIKDNHPERFKEIYDDKHLMKNKKLEAKNEKESYLANLNQDTFVLEEVMKKLNTNKPSIYSLLKKHNPILLEQLQFSVKCIHCSFKTRTSGKNKVGNLFLTRYKCLNPQCRKSFLDKNNHE